jgi:hypothetical protein
MKIYQRADKKEGDELPNAWLAHGKISPLGWYVAFALCLPNLMALPVRGAPFTRKVGWYIPRIVIVYYKGWGLRIDWMWEFSSYFMGEECIERYDHSGNLWNCPRCNGHILWKSCEEGPPIKVTIRCERCKHEYPEPGREDVDYHSQVFR